jgi:hypothetical protein
MTGADPRAGGSHRRVDRGRRLRVLLVSLLVVVIAGGGVEAALHWRGESKRPSPNAASSAYVSPRATPSGSPSPSSAASSSAAGSTLPGLTSSAASAPASTTPVGSPVASFPPLVDATTPPAATPSSASPAPSTSASAVKPPVDILNSTHVGGMAARADTTLTRGGWIVGLTGNYTHLISTTVFYPDGQLAAAQALAAQFTAIDKVAPAPDGVSTTDLTLVLGQDWTSSGK